MYAEDQQGLSTYNEEGGSQPGGRDGLSGRQEEQLVGLQKLLDNEKDQVVRDDHAWFRRFCTKIKGELQLTLTRGTILPNTGLRWMTASIGALVVLWYTLALKFRHGS